MQQSNTYIIVFSAIMTIVVGGLLSFTSQVLGPAQKKAVEFDTKRQILRAVMEVSPEDDVLAIYDARIKSLVVNAEGEVVETDEEGNPIVAENVDVGKQYKKPVEERLLPLFIYHDEGKPEAVNAYILPVYGNGLWDNIWGFLALDTDLATIQGIVFDHAAETPGLGARITDNEVAGRYNGKKIFDQSGEFTSVTMLKGENNEASKIDEHTVDGMSGATLTANGVNTMLDTYLQLYLPYLKEDNQKKSIAELK